MVYGIAMPRRRAAFLLLLALAPVPASAADRWLSAKTQHFDVLGNVGEGQLKRVALKFEQFRAVLDEVLIKGQGLAGPELPRPLVFVFKDRSESRRAVTALAWRVGLSLGLFLFLMAAYYFGFIPGRL